MAAVGTGRYRLPKGAVPGLKKKFIAVKLKLSQPKDCRDLRLGVGEFAGDSQGVRRAVLEIARQARQVRGLLQR